MNKCSECFKVISESAETCPNCGSTDPFNTKKVLGNILNYFFRTNKYLIERYFARNPLMSEFKALLNIGDLLFLVLLAYVAGLVGRFYGDTLDSLFEGVNSHEIIAYTYIIFIAIYLPSIAYYKRIVQYEYRALGRGIDMGLTVSGGIRDVYKKKSYQNIEDLSKEVDGKNIFDHLEDSAQKLLSNLMCQIPDRYKYNHKYWYGGAPVYVGPDLSLGEFFNALKNYDDGVYLRTFLFTVLLSIIVAGFSFPVEISVWLVLEAAILQLAISYFHTRTNIKLHALVNTVMEDVREIESNAIKT